LVAASLALILFAGTSVVWAATGRAAVTRQHPVAEDPQKARVIVRFKSQSALLRSPRVGPQHAATLAGRTGLRLRNGRMLDAQSQVVHGQGLSSTQLRQRLLADPDVESVVVDERRWALAAAPVVNDPLFGPQDPTGNVTPLVGQWYLQAPDAVVVSAINAVGAWALTTGSSSITVAVVDTGVRFDHPDLVGKFFPGPAGANYGYGYDFVSVTSISVDGDAADADASDPGTWGTAAQCDGIAEDSSWHGTKVAGLIGAQTNNGVGMASVGRQVMLLPVRALGQCGSGYDSDIVTAMKWAGGIDVPGVPTNIHPAQVINLSLGGADNSTGTSCDRNGYTAVVAQLNAKGIVVVAAAGNDEGLAVAVPGRCPGVIGVAGVRHIGTKVGFSNIGPELTIAAPGGNCVNVDGGPCLYPILTTFNTGKTVPTVPSTDAYTDNSVGTSFSAPLVAATVALMQSVSPLITPAQVKAALQATARSFPASGAPDSAVSGLAIATCQAPSAATQDECYCTTATCGAGLLDASAAVARAAATSTPVPHITTAAAFVEVGARVGFDASTSTATSGRTIAGYQWVISSGAAIATITSATNAATAQVAVSGTGPFTISLSVIDSLGIASPAAANSTVTVLAPSPPSARIGVTPASPTVGQSLIADSNGSAAMPTRSLAAYQWAITAGAGVAAISGSATGSTATLTTNATGTFTLSLTVTDSGGLQASTSQVVTVAVAPPPSSGGAGGVDGRWLIGLALAVVTLRASAAVTKRKAATPA
jgi:serine protease